MLLVDLMRSEPQVSTGSFLPAAARNHLQRFSEKKRPLHSCFRQNHSDLDKCARNTD